MIDNIQSCTIETDQLERLTRKFGLPLHIIFLDQLRRNAMEFLNSATRVYPDSVVAFAVKSNPCRGAIRAVSRLDIGIDAVSEFELQTALEESVSPAKIICNGNAKSDNYINMIVDCGALAAIDSFDELDAFNRSAGRKNKKIKALLRFSDMPLEGLTSTDQSTASSWTKFGFSFNDAHEVFNKAIKYQHVHIKGISAHIGTQVCDLSGYVRLFEHFFRIHHSASKVGLTLECFDIGGGYPVSYMSQTDWSSFKKKLRNQLAGESPVEDWVTWDNIRLGYGYLDRPPIESDPWKGKAYWSEHPGVTMLGDALSSRLSDGSTVASRLKSSGSPRLILEPGRALLGTAGITIARVITVKYVRENLVVAVDMGINNHGTNLVTPDIFPMEILPSRPSDTPVEAFIAGRLCFTGDMISKVKVRLNRLPVRGDLLRIGHTGAYCADHFASNSCGFPRPAKIAIDQDGSIEIWRERESYKSVFDEVNQVSMDEIL